MPSVRDALEGFVAGRVTAEQLVAAVTADFYRDARNGMRDALRPIIDVIERAHPGIVDLGRSAEPPGFAVKLAERPFPKRYESELRTAVSLVVQTHPASRIAHPEETVRKPGLLHRIVVAVRKLFSA